MIEIETKFENCIAPLSEKEFESLKQSIQQEGCREAIVTWRGVIIDGHNRYRVCTELGIPYKTIEMDFEDEEHARLWMVQNQIARRNIKPFQKCEMVYPLEKVIKRKNISKARHGKTSETGTNSSRRIAEIISEFIDVGITQWKQAKYIIENGDETLKAQVRSGEKSIYAAYRKLKERPKKVFTPIIQLEKPITLHYENPNRERTPRPFEIVRDDVRATVETMLKGLESNLNCVQKADVKKLSELTEILKQGYTRAKKMIQEEEDVAMVGGPNADTGNAENGQEISA